MELRQLAVVVAVAEEGGFTAAAQRLRTVQSTVSTVVRALERDLGTPLFHRTTHRVVLTPAGEAFVPAARAALEAAERARAAVSPLDGHVRLGVCPGLLADLHRTLSRLRHTHPGLVVEVRQLRPEEVGRGMRESDVDVALISAPGTSAAGRAAAGSATFGYHGTPPAAEPAPTAAHSAAEPTILGHCGPPPPAGPAPAGHRAVGEPTILGHHTTPAPAEPAPAGGRPVGEPTISGHHGTPPPAGPAPAGGCPEGEPPPAPDASAAEPVITLLPPEELVLVTAPGGSRSAPGDLSGLSLVDFPPGWAVREAVDLAFPHRRISLEVDDLAVAAGLVRAGLAACVLPSSAAARFPELTVRRFERTVPWQLAAVYRGGGGAAVAALLAQLG